MKLKKEELVTKFKEYAGERTDDATISLLEDISDSVSDDEVDVTEYEKKLKDLDETWRKKYIERFNGKVDEDTATENEEIKKTEKYEDLFEED